MFCSSFVVVIIVVVVVVVVFVVIDMDFDQLQMERIVEWILKSDPSLMSHVQRPYFLVIFNNRQWSDYFRRRRIEEMERNFRAGVPCSIFEPPETLHQSMLESQFNQNLRHLVNSYMYRTQRPFPLKYFIDLTDI